MLSMTQTVDSHDKFKLYFLELSGVFKSMDVESMDTEG